MKEDYLKAKKLGEKQVRKARGEGKDPYLAVLDEILPEADSLPHVRVGEREIPIRMITGTKTAGRARAFSYKFMPIMPEKSELAYKWSNLYDAQIEEGIRDPIQVFEYMLHFYVQEGNKRVSVLTFLDVPSIEASITRIMPKESDDTEYELYQEFLQFYACVPIYDIVFTRPGSYHAFANLVHQDLEHPWDSDFINVVRGAFFRFYNVFVKKGGLDLPITPGDAFLLYLQVYRFDSLLDHSRSDIEERLDEVWKEVLLETKNDKVSLIKEPIEEEKRGLFSGSSLYNANHPLKILFVYGKDPRVDSWENDHENGRIYLNAKFGKAVKTEGVVASALKDDPIRIGNEVSQYDVVFTTRRELMTDTLRVALKYPNTRFFNCSIFLNYQAVSGYFGRMYEAMFLLGRIAAFSAKNHKIGYVTNAPVYGRLSEINAFAIGASLVDPEAEIYLEWTGIKGGNWTKTFTEQGVEVYAGPEWNDISDVQPVHGVRRRIETGTEILAMPIWNWNLYYEKIVLMIMDRNWDRAKSDSGIRAMNCWWGMDAGVIDVIPDKSLPWTVTKDMKIYQRLLMKNAWNPFEGELRSTAGQIQKDSTDRLPSDQIIAMNWLNHNVHGRIPMINELNEDMQKLASMSGVKGTSGL